MAELIRDTVFGHLCRLLTGKRVLQFIEEKNPSIVDEYIHREKSDHMRHHGAPELQEEDGEKDGSKEEGEQAEERQRDARRSSGSSQTRVAGLEDANEGSKQKVDPEKGRDVDVVHWFDEHDQEVRTQPIE